MTDGRKLFMKTHLLRRVLTAILALACILSVLPEPARAELVKIKVAAEYANVYETPSTAARLLRKPPKGSVMTCAAVKGDWCYVKYDGTIGYVLKSAISACEPEKEPAKPAEPTAAPEETKPTPAPTQKPASPSAQSIQVQNEEKCIFYKTASKTGLRHAILPKGTSMSCTKTSGIWARVTVNGKTGYVLKEVLCKDTSSSTTPAPATPAPEGTPKPASDPTQPPKTDAANGQKVVLTAKATFYKSASTSAPRWGAIAKGRTVLCTKTSGIWARVEASNTTGYVLKALLKKAPGEGTPTPAKPTEPSAPSSNINLICYLKENTNIFSGAAESASVLATGKRGDKILVAQVKAGWAKLTTTKGVVGYVPSDVVSKTKIQPEKKVVLADWYESNIQKIYSVGTNATVIDVDTGISFSVRRKGGIKHADTETLSKTDTQKMLKAYGGEWSWDRRAIWLVIDGVYYAASMNGMGHGEETSLSNDLEGHFCIHFLNSRTHGTNKVCPLHQACVKKAYQTKP